MREGREPRSEPCACGGIITTSSKAGIRLVVRMHNGSLLHRQWRLGQQVREMREETMQQEVPG